MATWIHFTANVEWFEVDGRMTLAQIENDELDAFTDEGLFVYKYHADFPVDERSSAWSGRTALLVHCDEQFVELVQEDPTGENPDNDEYMIRIENFDKCEIEWY